MTATITQRFTLDGVEVDAESDCRFCFFFRRYTGADGEPSWVARLVRHWYEKACKVPHLGDELLATFPSGYRYSGHCHEVSMKAKSGEAALKVKLDMPGHWGAEHDARCCGPPRRGSTAARLVISSEQFFVPF